MKKERMKALIWYVKMEFIWFFNKLRYPPGTWKEGVYKEMYQTHLSYKKQVRAHPFACYRQLKEQELL